MFTSTVWTNDRKFLQESNLTARQPRRAPFMLNTTFNKRSRLANEGLVNLTGMPSMRPLREVNSVRQHQMFPTTIRPPSDCPSSAYCILLCILLWFCSVTVLGPPGGTAFPERTAQLHLLQFVIHSNLPLQSSEVHYYYSTISWLI